MATAKKNPELATPDKVALHCEESGETRDFDSAHATYLLEVQQRLGITGDAAWQPVGDTPTA